MAEGTTPEVQHTPTPTHPKIEGGKGGGIKGFFLKDTMGLPNWGWAIIIIAGIAAAYFIPKLLGAKGNATTTGTTPDSGLGLAIDPTTGLPYAVEGLVPSGGTVGTTPAPSPTPTPTPSPQCNTGFHFQSGALGEPIPSGSYPVVGGYCVPDNPGTGTGTTTAKIRDRFSLPAVKSYDQSNPGGVPIRSSPADAANVVGLAPFGSSVTLTSGPITGSSNFKGSGGSSIWYKTSSGYISLYDLILAAASGGGGGPSLVSAMSPAWPGGTMQMRRG